MIRSFLVRLSILTLLVAGLTACGSDTTKKGDGADDEECPDGQRFNPVLDQCEVVVSNNGANNGANNGNNGTGSNNGNNDTNNGGSDAGMNNGGSDAGMNNGGGDAGNNNGNGDMGLPPCGEGTLIGKACAPSGEPLAAADVTVEGVDCDGNDFTLTTRTAGDGTFQIDDVPAGNHELTVSTGTSFTSTRGVFIQPDQTTDLTSAAEKVCIDQNVDIAVIGGRYDHVEGILGDLNLSHDMKGDDDMQFQQAVDFLKDYNAMSQYDIIFINCGELHNTVTSNIFSNDAPTIAANLKQFVESGKSLYASDWAGPWVERAFPGVIDFHGNDSNYNEAFDGYAPQDITATVSPDLQAVLGRGMATIEFPHDPNNMIYNNNWSVADAAGPSSTAHVQGDAELCADPQGTPFDPNYDPCPSGGGTQTDAALLVTHKHNSGGTVIFTSFHNERQSTLNQDMEKILRFLIFQL